MKFTGNAKSDPSTVFPADDYFLTCTGVQDKDKFGNALKSKQGNDMWVLEMTVSEGQFKNRKLWHYLVFLPEGVQGHGMALRALHAFGLQHEGEIDVEPYMLEGVTIKAKVGIQPEKDGFPAKNNIVRWYVPTADDSEAGGAQEPESGGDTSFPPKEEAPKPSQELADKAKAAGLVKPAPAKKPLWGGKK